jgi:hypothetical protein
MLDSDEHSWVRTNASLIRKVAGREKTADLYQSPRLSLEYLGDANATVSRRLRRCQKEKAPMFLPKRGSGKSLIAGEEFPRKTGGLVPELRCQEAEAA